MQYRFAFTIAVSVSMVLSSAHASNKHKRSNKKSRDTDVFHVLLGLYKINPLKSSQVYKEFSNYVLSGGVKHVASNFDLDEAGKQHVKQVRTDLRNLEKVIHAKGTSKPQRDIDKPEFDVEDVDTENFNVNLVVHDDAPPPKPVKIKKYIDHLDNFDTDFFSHIESNEVDDYDDTTAKYKDIPDKDNIINNPRGGHVVFNGTTYNFVYDKDEGRDYIGSMVEVHNELPTENREQEVMDNKLDTADVVVL